MDRDINMIAFLAIASVHRTCNSIIAVYGQMKTTGIAAIGGAGIGVITVHRLVKAGDIAAIIRTQVAIVAVHGRMEAGAATAVNGAGVAVIAIDGLVIA